MRFHGPVMSFAIKLMYKDSYSTRFRTLQVCKDG